MLHVLQAFSCHSCNQSKRDGSTSVPVLCSVTGFLFLLQKNTDSLLSYSA